MSWYLCPVWRLCLQKQRLRVDMDACSQLHVCSEQHDLGKKTRSPICHKHFYILIFFLYGILFDATGESCMWPSQTPGSVVTSPSCVWASLIQLIMFHIRSVRGNLWLSAWRTGIPFVSTIYCLHNTGFWFVTDWLLCIGYTCFCMSTLSHVFMIATIWKVWYGAAGGW